MTNLDTNRRRTPGLPAVSSAWNLDWDLTCSSVGARRALRSWADDPVLGGFASLPDLLVAAGYPSGDDAAAEDRVMGALIGRMRTDRIAARIVLQRMLPVMVRAAGRYAGGQNRRQGDVLDDLMSEAWLAAARLADKPNRERAAGRISLTAIWEVRWRPIRRKVEGRERIRLLDPLELEGDLSAMTRGASVSQPADTPVADRSAAALLEDVLADAMAAGVPADRVALLACYGYGNGPADEVALAAEAGVTTRAIRYRREAATRLVRDAVEVAA